MNSNEDPSDPSDRRSRLNPSYECGHGLVTLGVIADDRRCYHLPYAQFLYAEILPNPALENDAGAPAEKLRICFATAEVTVLGGGLQSVGRMFQRGELRLVKAAGRRYAALFSTHVASVSVTFTKEQT